MSSMASYAYSKTGRTSPQKTSSVAEIPKPQPPTTSAPKSQQPPAPEPATVPTAQAPTGWDDGEDDEWGDDFANNDSGSDYGAVEEAPKKKEPVVAPQAMKLAKNDLSKATSNLKSKSKKTKAEDDIWGDLKGDAGGKDSDDWGGSDSWGTKQTAAKTTKSEDWGNDQWGTPSPVSSKPAPKPKLSPSTRRAQGDG